MPFPIRSLVAATILSFAAPAVAAVAVHFEAGGPQGTSFTIAKQPVPASFVSGSSFLLNSVKGVFNGTAGRRSIEFFNNSLGGGFQVVGGSGIVSQQVYIHDESAPFIETGDYFAKDKVTGANVGLVVYQQGTIGSAPEPITWALMITGFGLVGVTMRGSQWSKAAV